MNYNKLKKNKLHFVKYDKFPGAFVFPAHIPIGKSKQSLNVSISLGINELEKGKITVDLWEQKLQDIFRAFRGLINHIEKKQQKKFLVALKLAWNEKRLKY
jgi:hypothetical protein